MEFKRLLAQSKITLQQGKLQDTELLIRQFLAQNRGHRDATRILANLYNYQKRWADLVALLAPIASNAPSTVPAWVHHYYATALLLQPRHYQDYVVSARHFRWALRQDPKLPGAFDGLHQAAMKKILTPATYTYQIDIVGTCNLRCPSCPVGNFQQAQRAPKGFMTLETLEKILDKIGRERPGQRVNIDLFNWGEPLLHPEIERMIALVQGRGYFARLSSNLNQERFLEAALRAQPNMLKISLSGYYQESYGQTHARGNIERVRENIAKCREIIDRFNLDVEVLLGYHLYKTNLGDDYEMMRELARQNLFIFYSDYAILSPIEKVLAYFDGELEPGSAEAKIIDRLIVDPREGYELYQQDAAKRLPGTEQNRDCKLRRGFMALNWDGSVGLCCAVYDYQNNVAENYLDTPEAEINKRRYEHPLCRKCAAHGLDQIQAFGGSPSIQQIRKQRFDAIRAAEMQKGQVTQGISHQEILEGVEA